MERNRRRDARIFNLRAVPGACERQARLDASTGGQPTTTVAVEIPPVLGESGDRQLTLLVAVRRARFASVLTGLSGPSALMWAGFLSGLAIGIRSQTALPTLPLLVLALLLPRSGLRPQNDCRRSGGSAFRLGGPGRRRQRRPFATPEHSGRRPVKTSGVVMRDDENEPPGSTPRCIRSCGHGVTRLQASS